MKKLYIDIDGVLLTAKNTTIAEHAVQFIDFITDHYDCYWLTTHCKGNNKAVLIYLANYFNAATLKKIETIKPTNWTTLKTEAIDFASDFYWLEDYPMEAEIKILTDKAKTDRLIIVELNNAEELKRIMKKLKTE